jgi:hypothetical protein
MRIIRENMELRARVERLEGALEKIKGKDGYCIFGSSEMSEDPEQAYRDGSAQAFYDCAEIAREALKQGGADHEG